ncbi:hypothetical protein N0V88_005000 [Collariella sp. IMI 366227]|nr:hypothetical protein N0V88_005000 [Collariella sp. IMI 366227]
MEANSSYHPSSLDPPRNDTLISEPSERGMPRAALVDALFSEDVKQCHQLLGALVFASLVPRFRKERPESSALSPADVHTKELDGQNCTLLQVAAGRGTVEAEGFLLDREVPMNYTTNDTRKSRDIKGTLFHRAAANGPHQVVKLLLKSYPEDESFPYGIGGDNPTPLHRAAHNWNVAGMKALLDFSADPDVTDEYGRQPLHWAAIGRCLSARSTPEHRKVSHA